MNRWCAVALVIAPAAALAEPTEEQTQQSRAFVERAVAASRAGDHATAAQLYQRAYRVSPQPELLWNIASEYQLLDKPRWALTYFCQYITEDPNGSNVMYAKGQARALFVGLGGDASVSDDDVCKPILASDPGASADPPAPQPGDVTPTESEKPAPPAPSPAPPPPAMAPIAPEPEDSRWPPLRIAGVGLAGLGVVAFGIGAYYGFEAMQIDDELTNHPVEDPWPVDLRAREARGESYNRRAIALMAGGGAAVVIGVAAFVLFGTSSSATETVTLAPVVSPDNLGLAAAGRF